MVRFFKNIRQQLASENKVMAYLRYAIGEILLVVIGILIALQVNNWNQDRLARIEGEHIKQNIHEEFIKNQKLLKESRQLNNEAFNACSLLMKLVGAEKPELARYNLDSLFNSSLFAELYLPTRNSLEDFLQSGRMNLLGSEELKNTILSWNAAIDQFKEYKSVQTNWQNNHYMPYLLSEISYKQLDMYSHKSWSGKSKLKTDYYPAFKDIKFENLIDNNLWLLQYLLNQLDNIEKYQKKIIELTGDK